MHGAGREDITTTLNNCYVVAVRNDSIKSIYDTIINEALTYKYGGGCGHDLSICALQERQLTVQAENHVGRQDS